MTMIPPGAMQGGQVPPMPMPVNPKTSVPKGHKPEHGTHKAMVKSKSNKGMYTPTAKKSGTKGATPKKGGK